MSEQKSEAIKLGDYLDGMKFAATADDLEAAIQAPFKHSYRGRTWETICRVRIEAGNRIVDAHPHAFYIPRFRRGRRLTCCGETYRVEIGQNSTGVRYVWYYAGKWAKALLQQNGFGIRAAYRMWASAWHDYPHRCISLVEDVLAGEVPDPELHMLIHDENHSGSPIKYTVAQNDSDQSDRRATRPCDCGGTLFDWGGGFSGGFDFINWRCNRCPGVFTEYMTSERFYGLRQGKAA